MREINPLIVRYQMHFVIGLAGLTAGIIIYIFWSYDKIRRKKLAENENPNGSENIGLAGVDSSAVESDDDEKTIKKSISFNTVYNLEEFMVRLYRLGFLVRRIKNGGIEKERFLSIDQKGNIFFHKLKPSNDPNQFPKKSSSPYIRLPICDLNECFVCADSPHPSFIMDFRKKTLHLGTANKMDRDYIVKGIKLLVQRAKGNSSFLLRSNSLLEESQSPSFTMRLEEDEDDGQDDWDDGNSQTTMNTAYRPNRR